MTDYRMITSLISAWFFSSVNTFPLIKQTTYFRTSDQMNLLPDHWSTGHQPTSTVDSTPNSQVRPIELKDSPPSTEICFKYKDLRLSQRLL